MPTDDVKFTLRLPKDLNQRVEEHIEHKIQAGARRYSKNDLVLDAIEALLKREKPSGKK